MPALSNTVHDTALIFEGGGLRAAVTGGMVEALLEADLHFGWVAGISAGSTHLVNYVSRDIARARASFTDFVADPQFGGLRTLVRGQGYFNARYIYQEAGLPQGRLPFDWETFCASPAQFRIGAFDATDDQVRYWGREDVHELADVLIRVQASSSLPVVMPPVTIDGHVYVDGALGGTGGIALDAARADGYEKFVFVLTQPRGYLKDSYRNDWYVKRHFRSLPSIPAALRERPAHYNATRAEVFALEEQGRAYVFAPTSPVLGNSERDQAKLRASYEAGLAQARAEIPTLEKFLGRD
ncbi:patatin-like phospholipase family protein [Dermacoccaceae bacterium W4C1]